MGQGYGRSRCIEDGGYVYAVLDGTHPWAEEPPSGQKLGHLIPFPIGWELASGDPHVVHNVIARYPWGTHWIATQEGAFATALAETHGLACGGESFYEFHWGHSPAATIRGTMCGVDQSMSGSCVRVLIQRRVYGRPTQQTQLLLTEAALRQFNASARGSALDHKMRLLRESQGLVGNVGKPGAANANARAGMSPRIKSSNQPGKLKPLQKHLKIACEQAAETSCLCKLWGGFRALQTAATDAQVDLTNENGNETETPEPARKQEHKQKQTIDPSSGGVNARVTTKSTDFPSKHFPSRESSSSLDTPRHLTVPDGLDVDLHIACDAVLAEGWSRWKFPDNFTPLHLAAYQGSREAVQFFIAWGASVDLRRKDNVGKTPLDYAVLAGHRDDELLELLRGGRDTHGWSRASGKRLTWCPCLQQIAQATLGQPPRRKRSHVDNGV